MPNLKSVEDIQNMNPNDFFSRDLCGNTYLHSIAKNPILLKAAFAMLSPNQLQQASIIKNIKNETLLHLAAATLDSLELVLDLYDKEAKIQAIQEKNIENKTPFHFAAPTSEALKILLALLPTSKERLIAIKEKSSEGCTVLHFAACNSESLKIVLDLYPTREEQCLAIKEKSAKDIMVLHQAAHDPESLKIVLDFYPTREEQLVAINTRTTQSKTVLHFAALHLNSLEFLLKLYFPKEQLQAIRIKDAQAQSVFFLATIHAEFFKKTFALYSLEEKLQITKERCKENFSLLHQAAADSESIQMILNLYSNKEQIDLITQESQMENSPLNRAISFPESFRIMLNALPPPSRLLFLSKRRRRALIDYGDFPEQNYYYPLLDHLQKKPDSLAIALSLLPEKDRLVMILEGDRSNILLDATSKPESLKIIFSLLPKEDRFKAINHEVHGGKIIHQVALYPESLMIVLRSLSLEEQLNALKIETPRKKTVLEQIISNPSLFMNVFALVPEKLQLQVINEEKTNGNKLLHVVVEKPELLKIILNIYPQEEQLKAINEKNLAGHTVIDCASICPESLQMLLALYSEEDRPHAIKNNKHLLQNALSKPESLRILLNLIPETERLEAIKQEFEIKRYKRNLLHAAVEHPESIKVILNSLRVEDQIEAINTQEENHETLLLHAISYPKTLEIILNLLPESVRLELLLIRNIDNIAIFHEALYHPNALKILFNALSQKDRFNALQIKNHEGKTLLQRLVIKNLDFLYDVLPSLTNTQVCENLLTFEQDKRLLSLNEETTAIPVGVLALNIVYVLEKNYTQIRQAVIDTYAGNKDRIRQAEKRFEKVQDFYKTIFEEQYNSSIEKVEQDLKRALLKKILQAEISKPEDKQDQSLIHLLTEENIIALSLGDKTLSSKLRPLLNSTEDIFHIAWRTYDEEAPTQGWDNLFIKPTADKKVYSEEAPISLNKASDAVRVRASMYYLAAADESNEELKASKEERLEAFFANIAECRRAHNTIEAGDRQNTQIDNPSCYPGTITRLSFSALKHPSFKESLNIQDFIRLKVQAIAENTLEDIFSSDSYTSEQKYEIYAATRMLGLGNLSEILLTPNEKLIQLSFDGEEYHLDELTAKRGLFLSLMNIGEVLQQVCAYLDNNNVITEQSLIDFYVIQSMLDLGGLNLSLTPKQLLQLGIILSDENEDQEGVEFLKFSEVSPTPSVPSIKFFKGAAAVEKEDAEEMQIAGPAI